MPGQIIKRGKNTWLVRVYMGRNADGKRRYHNKTIHGTKKEAEKYLGQVLRDRDMGIYAEPSKQTLGEYLDQWLEKVAKPRVMPRTFSSYSGLVNSYIRPGLGDRRLDKLNPLDIQELYNDMQERGLSPRTVRYVHAVLHSALDQAMKWGLLVRNVTELVDLPRRKRKEMRCLSPDEARAFMETAKEERWGLLFLLMLTTGLRPGEALGLRWNDVDFENKRLYVRYTLVRVRNQKSWKLEEPKTSKSRRTVPLPDSIVKMLSTHQKNQAEEILKNRGYKNHGFVFASNTGEPVIDRNLLRDFKSILKKTGLPDIRLYDLRHTCATLLLVAGENPKVVSERLGHSSVTLTLDTYSHVLPDMQKAATQKLENMLFVAEES